MWWLLQSSIMFAVCASNIHWHWTPNGYIPAVAGGVLAKAKAAGVYKGRPPSVDRAKIADLKAQGFGPSQIARKLNIGRASVYRAL